MPNLNRKDVTYFGAGPAGLPTTVLEGKVASAVVNHQGLGLGVAEISHRSAEAKEIVESLKANLATYLNIPSDFEILLMQGGGSGQFAATAQNLCAAWVQRRHAQIQEEGSLNEEESAKKLKQVVDSELKLDYIVTGSWSQKASEEAARLLGEEHVNIVANAKSFTDGKKFGVIPDEKHWKLSKDAAMIYFCDNETVDGVEFPAFPQVLKSNGPSKPIVVADMSSNILSRSIPFEHYSAIFFGAQKNLGSAGITVVAIRKSLLADLGDWQAAKPKETPSASLLRSLGLGGAITPKVFSYNTCAANGSLYNTLSILDAYIAGEVVKEALQTFPDKISGQEAVSNRKAEAIYAALDKHPGLYKVVPDKAARSRMNICFTIDNADSQKKFLADAESQGLFGLKGHRSVGGIRASNYNSVSEEGATKLVAYINDFAGHTKNQ